MVKKAKKGVSRKTESKKKTAITSVAEKDGRKRRKKSRAPPVKGLRYKLATARIMKGVGLTNPVRADTHRVIDQMNKEIPRNVMTQVSIQANALARRKQKKQRGLKGIHVTNAVLQLIPTREGREDYLAFVQDRLRQFHTITAE